MLNLFFVSKNFRFGKKIEGNIETLKKMKNTLITKLLLQNHLRKNTILSSTRIRKKISLGLVKEV